MHRRSDVRLRPLKFLRRRTKLEVQTRDGLREISHGRWEQMTRREVEEKYPEEAAEWEKDPYTFAPVGGESGLAVTARALPVLVELVRKHPGENILVVSHKATIRLLLSSLLGFDPRRYRDNLDQKPAALNIVDFKDATRARLTLFNDTSHCAAAGEAVPPIPERRLSKCVERADNARESEVNRRRNGHYLRRSGTLGRNSRSPSQARRAEIDLWKTRLFIAERLCGRRCNAHFTVT